MPTYFKVGSFWIEIRTKEKNHLNTPHVHVHLGKEAVSMTLDGKILSGSMRSNKVEEARTWVLRNSTMLREEWRRIYNV